MDLLDLLDLLALLDLQELVENKDHKALLVQLEHVESQVKLELLAPQEDPVNAVQEDLQDLLDHVDRMVLPDQEENKVHKEKEVLLVPLVFEGQLDLLVPVDKMVC